MTSTAKCNRKIEMCLYHPSEKIRMYCGDCDQVACPKCISGRHRNHQLDTIEEFVHKIQIEVEKHIIIFEDTVSSYNSVLSSVKTNYDDYINEIKTLTDKVNKKREEYKKQIDEIADMVLCQLQQISDRDLEKLKRREMDLNKNLQETEEFIKSCRDSLKSSDKDFSIVKLIEEIKTKGKTYNPCKTPESICPPRFTEGRMDDDYLKVTFGRIVRTTEMTVTVVTTIALGRSYTCVSAVGEDKAWIGYRYGGKGISLINKNGHILHKVDLRFAIGDITSTNSGEVLVNDYYNHQIKKCTKDGRQKNTVLNTYPYYTHGLCMTLDNDILVCLFISNRDNKVIRVTTEGETKQTIQYDENGKFLFSKPMHVQENINKDVCVVDRPKTLVVVDKDGEFRFRYPDKSTNIDNIDCNGIICDRLGNILLSDHYNHCVHLIDINGQFIQYVLGEQHGINKPWGLSVSSKGELWVCNENATKIVVIKYNS